MFREKVPGSDVKVNQNMINVGRIALGKYHIGDSTYKINDEAIAALYREMRAQEGSS